MSKILIANKDYIPITNLWHDSYMQDLHERSYFYGDTLLTNINNRVGNLKEDRGVFFTQQLKRVPVKLLAITCVPNIPEIIADYKNTDDVTLLKTQFLTIHAHFFINNDLLNTSGLKGSRLFKSFINKHLEEYKKKKKEYVHYLEEWELFNMFTIDDSKLLSKHVFKESKNQLKNEFIEFLKTKEEKVSEPELVEEAV